MINYTITNTEADMLFEIITDLGIIDDIHAMLIAKFKNSEIAEYEPIQINICGYFYRAWIENQTIHDDMVLDANAPLHVQNSENRTPQELHRIMNPANVEKIGLITDVKKLNYYQL